MKAFISLFIFTLATFHSALGARGQSLNFEADVKPFLEQHCVKCHGGEKSRGGLRLDQVSFTIKDAHQAENWQDVLDALNGDEMPPEEEARPERAELTRVIGTLTDELFAARRRLAHSRTPTMRRLNRREYRNTIKDLLGVPVDAWQLPEDGTLDGFDTIGDAQFMSEVLFEKYLTLGRDALDRALVAGPRPISGIRRLDVVNERLRSAERSAKLLKEGLQIRTEQLANTRLSTDDRRKVATRIRIESNRLDRTREYLGMPQVRSGFPLGLASSCFGRGSDKLWLAVSDGRRGVESSEPVRAAGRFIARFRLGLSCQPKPGERFFVEVKRADASIEGNSSYNESLEVIEITQPAGNPHVIEVPFVSQGEPGDMILVRLSGLTRTQRRAANARKPLPDLSREAHIMVEWLEIEGPIVEEWPAAAWQTTFFDGAPDEDESDYAKEIIRRFAARAFRRERPEPAYLEKLHRIFEDHRRAGTSFVDSIKEALSVVLASPGFIYLSEAAGGQRLSDRELACRLSYLLWSRPPDEALHELVEEQNLSDPDTLRQQTDRMLDDSRSLAFSRAFISQWLDLPWLEMIVVDKRRYPEFNEAVRRAFGEESVRFFHHLIQRDLSVANLIDSDFVVIDHVLAAFYEIPRGPERGFTRVDLPQDSVRGGLLGHGSVLTMTGTGERTSPVERGSFIYRRLLGRDLPPPPPNVPQLEFASERTLTVRETLTAHTEKPQCASCHQRIDPLGFGLEHFDPIGRWRDGEKIPAGPRKFEYLKIDATGTMPDGNEFDGHQQLKAHLMSNLDQMARGFLRSILTYSLGRRIGFADEDFLDRFQADWKEKNYGMRELVHAIVQSREFQHK